MDILFCNNSFPGNFEALAGVLAKEHSVVFASSYGRRDFSMPGVHRVLLKAPHDRTARDADELIRSWSLLVTAGRAARNAFAQLGRSGFAPDMVLFNAGCGEGLFVQSAFSRAFRAAYLDLDKMAPEGQEEEKNTLVAQTQGMALFHAHAAFAFGNAQNLPSLLRPVVGLIPPFVDTAFFSPKRAGSFDVDGRPFSRDAELISLDMKGYEKNGQNDPLPVTLAQMLRQRPKCHILLTCFDGTCPLSGAVTVLARNFPGRVHTMALASRARYRDMLVAATVRVLPGTNSRVRDLLESMSCGALLMAHPTFAGRAFVPGKTMLTWPESAEAQIRLLNAVLDNRQTAEILCRNGRELVQAEYDQNLVLSRHVDEFMAAYQRWRGGAFA